MFLSYAYRIVTFFLVVFVMVDIFILFNYALKDYGEPLKIENINRATIIFFSGTVILFALERLLRNK